ncbi:HAMP domain-containing histidine kinase [Actinoplanes sp. TRM 88003]|uniref:histidine kinase n=1 Tax=Paractinoplanes aksuensis TaxID=2939490 RepID=A0ABT1DLX9_9ACTN|nr:HAMP domain-containing sensor histidine kinase [Actinoplanes aksuensis]MCO8271853.1 HAMP domain-containing histidine kinase [Actinoplanes aksuensis]
MTPARVPLRHSLVTRLLATSVLIAIAAIGATAWLAARTATRAITQEQGRSLTEEKGVYDLLVGYAATHARWSGAQTLIDERAAKLGRRITLTTADRTVIADSGGRADLRTARPSALVDPLNLDVGLVGGDDRIDPRAAGPFRVRPGERPQLQKAAEDAMSCLRKTRGQGQIEQLPNGRPTIVLTVADADAASCASSLSDTTTPSEAKALRKLGESTAKCLNFGVSLTVYVSPDFTPMLAKSGIYDDKPSTDFVASEALFQPANAAGATRVRNCVEKSRRAMLTKYVAPPALLFVTDPQAGADQTRFTLSPANTTRIVATTGAVLLVTIVVTVLVGRRLVRPLRALTVAADEHRPVPVTRNDEIGRLARALNDSAERRDRAETQRRAMVSDVAHELRSPLTNIRSWLEAAQDDLAPTDGQLLTLLHEEAVQLQHIIDDLSDLAAADAGTLRVHPAPVVVRDLLAQVAEAHRAAADNAGVRLETATDGDPVLTADPVRLRQLLGNLVSNAIRYTPAGGTVTVHAHDTTITVRDTGIGISPDHLPKIFDRFWRADTSRSRATGGSGLGLSIARQLADAHNATLTATSTPGAGTTFTLELP